MRPSFVAAIAAVALGLVGACRRPPSVASVPEIVLKAHDGAVDAASVVVSGLQPDDLTRATAGRLGSDEWTEVLKVSVFETGSAADGLPAVQGRYAVVDGRIVFTPSFPFDAGRSYRVRFDAGRLTGRGGQAPVEAVVSLPARATTTATAVMAVHPGSDVVPENLLRMYIEFSAPMGNRGARDFVRLLDESGREVAMPFLPLDAPLWNADHTRCTVFFDPGRVKRGVLPNEEMGRPLRAGRRYVLEVGAGWPDANGRRLASTFRHVFRTAPAVVVAIEPSSWRIETPKAGTRDPVVVTFERPLDHALLGRALGVETRDRRPVGGDVTTESHDARWRLRPDARWEPGDYDLVARSVLEDPAGNRIGRAFEADLRGPNAEPGPDAYRVPFTVAGRPGSSK